MADLPTPTSAPRRCPGDGEALVIECDAFTPVDLAATIFHLLGIGADEEFRDVQGRPYAIYRGKAIKALV